MRNTEPARAVGIREKLRSFKKERIFEEASRLFFERGYHSTSLEAIADALQVTKPFIYYHFDRKLDLLLEIYLRILEYSLGALHDARAGGGTARQQLDSFVLLYTGVVIREQRGVTVFFREEASIPKEHLAEVNRLKGRFDDELSELIVQGIDAGEFHVTDLRLTTLGVVGLIGWTYTWYREGGRLTADEIAAEMSRLTLRLVGAERLA